MEINQIRDVSSDELPNFSFDLGIFVSGYEARSHHLYSTKEINIKKRLILQYPENDDLNFIEENKKLFETFPHTSINMKIDSDDIKIFSEIKKILSNTKNPTILVDYSSMSRGWLNSIINFFRFSDNFQEVTIITSYTIGIYNNDQTYAKYPKSDFEISKIENLVALDGATIRNKKTTVFIGLGFEWVSPFAICEQIEPDNIFTFFANPGASTEYSSKALKQNKAFLDEFESYSRQISIPLPLRSVESTFRTLASLIGPIWKKENVLLAPLGPKPHVLACILLANRFNGISCLHVRGAKKQIPQVRASQSSETVSTCISFIAN